MFRVELKGLLARKLRLGLTAFAIALGVTLMAGTYIFTDTISASFDSIFSESSKGTDVTVTPQLAFGSSNDPNAPGLSLPASLLERVRSVEGVATAAGGIFGQATTFDKKGKRLNKGGAPAFVASVQPAPFEGFVPAEGRLPRTADEMALDKATVDRAGFALGDMVAVQGDAPRKRYRLVGAVRLGGVDGLGGSSSAVMTLPEAQRVTGRTGRFDEIDVAAKPGVDKAALKAAIRKVVPARGVAVRTGDEQAKKQSLDLRDALSPLRTILLVFAYISLFVGGFIIFNTFSITVAQRTREFALFRMLGATRRQILRAVLGESLVLGVLGSLIGIAGGLAVAPGLKALLKAFGADLPANGLVIESRTIVVSLIVGVLVTLIGGVAPALRATRVPPVAALREGIALPAGRNSRFATPLAVLLTLAGVAALVVGLFAGLDSTPTLTFVGAGAAAVFIGVALLSPKLVRPLASFVGWPLERVQGLTGRLARENTTRLPGRTAVTAAALMIGVTLVTFVSVFAAGVKKTIDQAVDTGLRGDLILESPGGQTAFTDATSTTLAKVPGVAAVSPIRFVSAKVTGQSGTISVTGIDPATFSEMYRAGWEKGSDAVLRDLKPGDVVVGKSYAESHDLDVGSRLHVLSATGASIDATVRGIIHDKAGLVGDLAMPNQVIASVFGQKQNAVSFLLFDRGADATRTKKVVDATLERQYPAVEAKTPKEFKDEQAGQVNTLLALFYALLALAIVVSLFGIVNTLVLSIHERTRELGMLRAIGTSRRQVRRMIRAEAVITSLIGGVIGIVLGLGLSVLVTQAIDDFSLAIPVGTVILVFVLAGLAGVFAAILPARRAARLNVLEALAYE